MNRNVLAVGLLVFALAACESPPDGIRVEGDTASISGSARVQLRSGDRPVITPSPPRLAQRKWLYEHDFEYAYFEADTTDFGLRMDSILNIGGGPPVVWGRSVYRR